MRLKELLQSIDIHTDLDIEIKGISCDSRKIKKGYLYIAIKGNVYDGNDYIEDVLKNKAAYVLSDSIRGDNILYVPNLNELKAKLFYTFYKFPQDKLKIIGITGTNGKTSIAYILYDLLNKLNAKTMYIGTLGIYDDDYYQELANTTPDCGIIAEELYKANKRKTKYVIMEVSSHALASNRVDLIDFTGAIFTNLTHEHLDYHLTMENYLKCKQKLFNSLNKEAFAVINYDDKYNERIIEHCKAKIIPYGLETKENKINNISRGLDGVRFNIGCYENIESKLLGIINIYNLSAAFLCAKELGFNEDLIISKIKEINTINGRLEKIYHGEYTVILDYAHTPDAMEKVLMEIKPLVSNRLIVLFGCGGNRDTSKRPLMGKIATSLGDVIYLTSDNPRFEDPLNIIKDILRGCKNENKIVIEGNREKAIQKALKEIEKGDILMILGKGHEEYQIIGDNHIKCSDKEMINRWLQM